MEHSSQERMREMRFWHPRPVLPNRIDTEALYPGLHRYEIMSSPTFPDSPATSPRTQARSSWAPSSPRCAST